MVMEEKILNLHFYQGKSNYLVENNIKEKEYKQAVKAKIAEFFNMKNVCFLFGAGTSCPAIPNMAGLYAKVEKALKGNYMEKRFGKIAMACDNKLEEILSVLYQVELTIKVLVMVINIGKRNVLTLSNS